MEVANISLHNLPISIDKRIQNSHLNNLPPIISTELSRKTFSPREPAEKNSNCLVSIQKLKTECDPISKPTYHNVSPHGLSIIEICGENDLIPITIPQKFKLIADSNPQAMAYYYKDDWEETRWKSVTYFQYLRDIRRVARAFISLGLEKFHGVAIIGFNAPEWVTSNFAAIFAGGLSVGVYTTNSAEASLQIMMDCKANICVVEDWNQMIKILGIADKLPDLKAIIQYRENSFPSKSKLGDIKHLKILKWSHLDEYSEMTSEDTLNERIESLKPNNCSTLIYTSGTTGISKGVMISHDNLIWTSTNLSNYIKAEKYSERIISYLPLSHIAAQITDMYVTIESASSIWFAQPDAMKGSLLKTLIEVKPTIFMGVPRLWEKFTDKLMNKSIYGLKKYFFNWVRDVGRRGSKALMKGDPVPWGYHLVNRFVFSRFKTILGLNSCRYFISMGAPCPTITLDFFGSLAINIQEAYGTSECTGPASINYPNLGLFWTGSCGLVFPGTKVKILKREPLKENIRGQDITVKYDVKYDNNFGKENSHDESKFHAVNGDIKTIGSSQNEDMEGEILINGRHVFMGYLNMPQQTTEAIDSNGWLYTGDIGKLIKTTTGGPFLFITGRLKELIITAGGENIAPIPIENAIKEQLWEIVSNVMVIGDYRKFLSVILTFKTKMDINTGLCSQTLVHSVETFILNLINQGSSTESLEKPLSLKNLTENMPLPLKNYINDRMKAANAKSVSRAALIRKWVVLENDFTIAGGELGPTMKLRRPYILKKYAQIIESLYTDSKETSKDEFS
ncbi:unnamed protein product [Gordionus sp. m RMFG-2023]|uniref:long-chain-fatty-acid--CoA ligase ACSBG2-like n=1 Tax=Gordionus sp. m RMFG-2023 TaxID=3053472 RepID=UPI0030E1E011